jgi:hypothetical protein
VGAVVVTSTVAVAVIAEAAVLERADEAPALAMGAVRVGGAGVRGITCLGGSVGGMEKVAPALAMGALRVGRCRSGRNHLPWWQCWGRRRR